MYILSPIANYCSINWHVLSLQKCIASTESSGIDIVVQILQAELTALEDHQDLALELKVCIWYYTYREYLSLVF